MKRKDSTLSKELGPIAIDITISLTCLYHKTVPTSRSMACVLRIQGSSPL